MISAILAAAILLAESTPALQAAPDAAKPTATAQTVSQATSVAPKKSDPMALVCKSEPILGSRMPVKRCHTQGEIAQQRLEDRQALERAQIMVDPGH
jgi:hypothetical protein